MDATTAEQLTEVSLRGNVGIAFLLTLFAGLSTGVGSAVAYFIRKPKMVYLAFGLGLSAGVMVYISFMELLPEAMEHPDLGAAGGVAAFFAGFLLIFAIDRLVPEAENPHEYHQYGDKPVTLPGAPVAAADSTDRPPGGVHHRHLMRTGVFAAIVIAIHNFPEGLATFAAALIDPQMGVFIAIAIAIHNIPEGISISVPIYYATGSRRKAFFWSMLSGLAEPAGALLGYFLLMPFLTPAVLAGLMAFIGGIMVYVSLDELLPMAHRFGHGHTVILGIMIGMVVMAASLLMLG